MSDANSGVEAEHPHDEHVKFFSKFIFRRLKKSNQPQILTLDQAKQVDKDERYVIIFLTRLLECDVLANAGWLGDIQAFVLKEEAYKGDLTLDEIKHMLATSKLDGISNEPS